MTVLSPQQHYQAALAAGFKDDGAQRQAVASLELCYQQLIAGKPKVHGVYLWGPVGRGKTWLMDSFYGSLSQDQRRNVTAKRLHFHHLCAGCIKGYFN